MPPSRTRFGRSHKKPLLLNTSRCCFRLKTHRRQLIRRCIAMLMLGLCVYAVLCSHAFLEWVSWELFAQQQGDDIWTDALQDQTRLLRIPPPAAQVLWASADTGAQACTASTVEGRGRYLGYNPALSPGALLSVLVLPSVAHCCRVCEDNSEQCGGFTYTPGRRCYLSTVRESLAPKKRSEGATTRSRHDVHKDRQWLSVPGLVSQEVVKDPYTTNDQVWLQLPTGLDGSSPNLEVTTRDRLLSAPLSHDNHPPRRKGGWARSIYKRREARKELDGALAELRRQEAAPSSNKDHNGTWWLLNAGIDCCSQSQRLNSVTGTLA